MTLSATQQLDELGYTILDSFLDGSQVAELRSCIEQLLNEEGENAGAEFKQEPGCKRLANLVDKHEVFRRVIQMPEVLALVQHVIGDFKLSSCNARAVPPFSATVQPLHADQGAVADEQGFWVCNSLWMLNDFTSENGSLRVIPGSHRWRQLPQDVLSDPTASHPDEVLLTAQSGSVVVMNAHLWHGGTANSTSFWRVALHAFFVRRDKPQQQYQKQMLRPEVQKTLSNKLRRLLALDDPVNDELALSSSARSGFLE